MHPFGESRQDLLAGLSNYITAVASPNKWKRSPKMKDYMLPEVLKPRGAAKLDSKATRMQFLAWAQSMNNGKP